MNNVWHNYWPLFVIGIIWETVWKAFALWRSARNDDKAWFIALLILNTAGILEIFYIFVFSKRTASKKTED